MSSNMPMPMPPFAIHSTQRSFTAFACWNWSWLKPTWNNRTAMRDGIVDNRYAHGRRRSCKTASVRAKMATDKPTSKYYTFATSDCDQDGYDDDHNANRDMNIGSDYWYIGHIRSAAVRLRPIRLRLCEQRCSVSDFLLARTRANPTPHPFETATKPIRATSPSCQQKRDMRNSPLRWSMVR